MKPPETIAVLGLWHLGIITAVGLAELGINVKAYDPDKKKILQLAKGIPHIFEPELENLLKKNLKNKRLSFVNNIEAIKKTKFVYITFDTPLNEKDEVDISILFSLVKNIAPFIQDNAVIIISSQVPIGTTDTLLEILQTHSSAKGLQIAYIPENLRLGVAFERFFRPKMLVIGTQKTKTFKKVSSLLAKIRTKKIMTSTKTAELVKHAINTYLATSISYANEMGNIADVVGADFKQVSDIIRLDERIGPYARVDPGLGFAGGTLARDLKILSKIGSEKGYPTNLVNAVLSVNEWQKKWVVRKLKKIFKNNLKKIKIGVLGLTYTPQTSTLRRSLAVETIRDLLKEKAIVYAFDPHANRDELARQKDLKVIKSIDDLVKNADALVLMTEWKNFLDIDYEKIKSLMKKPIIIDPKNFLHKKLLQNIGFHYYGLGRGTKDEAI